MENRLSWLIKDASLTYRELGKYVGIDYSALSKIAKGKYDLSTSQIQRLVEFFSCTADFLLCINKEGVYVFHEYGFNLLDIDTYEKVKDASKISTAIINRQVVRTLTDKNLAHQFFIDGYYEIKESEQLLAKIIKLEEKMTEEELQNILKFIDTFILKKWGDNT